MKKVCAYGSGKEEEFSYHLRRSCRLDSWNPSKSCFRNIGTHGDNDNITAQGFSTVLETSQFLVLKQATQLLWLVSFKGKPCHCQS